MVQIETMPALERAARDRRGARRRLDLHRTGGPLRVDGTSGRHRPRRRAGRRCATPRASARRSASPWASSAPIPTSSRSTSSTATTGSPSAPTWAFMLGRGQEWLAKATGLAPPRPRQARSVLMASSFRCVLDVRASLGECPVWSARDKALYWVDINAPSLNRFDPGDRPATASMPMPESIGCFALRTSGGLRRRAAQRHLARARRRHARPPHRRRRPTIPRIIASTTAAATRPGRFFVGYMNEKRDAPSAALMRLDADGSMTRGARATSRSATASRGVPTAARCITPTRRRTTCARSTTTSRPARRRNARVFARWHGETDRPDGGAVDSEGNYWTRVLPRRQGRADLAARRARSPNIRCPRCARRCARSAAPTCARST